MGVGSGRFRAPRSTQEPGEGAEAKVRLRLQRRTAAGRLRKPRPPGGGGPGSATTPRPAPVYLHAGGGGAGLASAAAAAPERFPRAAGGRAQDVLSHAAPALGSRSSGTRHFLPLPSMTLTAPRAHPGGGSPRPGPRPPRSSLRTALAPGPAGSCWRRPEAQSGQGPGTPRPPLGLTYEAANEERRCLGSSCPPANMEQLSLPENYFRLFK